MIRPTRMKRFLLVLVVAAAVAGLGWQVLRLHPEQRPAPGPALAGRVRPQGDAYVSPVPRPLDLNPFTTSDQVSRRMVLRYTHDTLLDLDGRDLSLRPGLAAVESTGPEPLTWTLRLRDDAAFADGTPVTSADVRFSWRACVHPEVPGGSVRAVLDRIAALEVLDARRFRLRLREPHFAALPEVVTSFTVASRAWFLAEVARLAQAAGGSVPADEDAPGFGRLLTQVAHPGPGSGPYRLDLPAADARARIASADRLVLPRNPRSWRLAAQPECWNLDALVLRFVSDPSALFALLRTQEIDWYFAAEPEKVLADNPDVAAHYVARVYDQIGDGHYMVVWNHRRPGLADPRVRRALSGLFDREAIAGGLLHGKARVARSWFRPGTPEYAGDAGAGRADIAEVRALLAAAGCGPDRAPLRVSILAASGQELFRRILEISLPRFEQAGVELQAEVMDWGAVVARRDRGEFDGYLQKWTPGVWVDPYVWFHSSQAGGKGLNFMGYADPEMDAVLEQARREPDDTLRLRLWRRFHELFVRDEPVTLLVHPRSSLLVHRRFRGAEPDLLGLVPERWWVEPGEQLRRQR